MKFQIGLKKWSVFYLYCLWNVILAIRSFQVFGLGGSDNAQGHGALSQIIELYIAVVALVFIVGALLSWLAIHKGYLWSSWGFIVFCTWRAIDLLWGGYYLSDVGSNIATNTGDWIRVFFFALVWLFLMIKERTRMQNVLKKGTHLFN